MMKKILLLGGSKQQITAITTAKKLGYYTILCDYFEDNPGQHYSDKYYMVSTTDQEAVLSVAKKEKIDGILAYASDPAAPTAAYVAEILGLPGSPYESVKILCNKDLFRKHLSENGFNSPKAKGYRNIQDAIEDIKNNYYQFPVIVKPVDSSGSKGVSLINSVIDAKEKIDYAFNFSRNKRIVIEEYVEKKGYQIAGDGLSIDGTLVFECFANDHFNLKAPNPFVPIGASFPSEQPERIQKIIHQEIQNLLSSLNMKTSTYNFDLRIDQDDHVYLMEVAPRDGGNYIPNIIKYATGVDLAECAIRAAMGEKIDSSIFRKSEGYYSYFAVHSLKDGILKEIIFSEEIEQHILENHIIKQPGEKIEAFSGANTTLGCVLLKFDSFEQMIQMMEHFDKWCQVICCE